MTEPTPVVAVTARPRRWWRVAVSVGLTLLTLAAAGAIVAAEPTAGEQMAPFVGAAVIGETVEVGGVSVSVLGVRGAKAVYNGRSTYTNTEGIFIAVKVRVIAHRKPARISHVSVVGVVDRAEVIYEPTRRAYQHLEFHTFQPDVPIEGEFVFEVPTAGATTLTIQFGDAGLSNVELASFGEVPLEITEDRLSTWLAVTEPMLPAAAAVAA